MGFRISGAGSQRNPFQQGFQRQSVNLSNPFQLPKGSGDYGTNGFQSYLGRGNLDQQLNDRRKQQEQRLPEQLQQLLEQLKQREQEIARLRQQLEGAKDPTMKKELESMMNQKSSGFFSLQGQVNQHYKGLSSGFAGQENKIDHIGSFVTQV